MLLCWNGLVWLCLADEVVPYSGQHLHPIVGRVCKGMRQHVEL